MPSTPSTSLSWARTSRSAGPERNRISARTTLQRSQWGMIYGVKNGMVGDEVLLSFEFEAMRD